MAQNSRNLTQQNQTCINKSKDTITQNKQNTKARYRLGLFWQPGPHRSRDASISHQGAINA